MIVNNGKTYESEFNSILDSHVSPSKDEWSVAQSPNFRVGKSFQEVSSESAEGDMSSITQGSMMSQRTMSEKLPGTDITVPPRAFTEPAGALKPEGRYPPTGKL